MPTALNLRVAHDDGEWPFYRRSMRLDRPVAMIAAADLGFETLGTSPFWHLDPPTVPTLDIHLADCGIAYRDFERFITQNGYDQIADYDVLYECQAFESSDASCEIFIATTHADKADISGWAALKRTIAPSPPNDGSPHHPSAARLYSVELANVFVIPPFRGFGVGRALLHAALRSVKGDLMVMAAGGERFAPRFHAECVSRGGAALAQRFSDEMRELVARMPSGAFQALDSWIE